ncbi:rod shape-determining protein MreC [Salinimicrobium catena]|uniref:Cell shape-determining protein MreC n=1 Tax=Salinimicrobium catena TaxID=390640 RepID=A0A1H5JYT7_9FLAO|nr:rod shape-determining protein MreC [Salinimicrobium catena]SDK92090.1 rod shape-determining protein MreC [Salinimicrobium catena]SEE57745.1 rod shape-determining protein MreC [Salinimicrobium catena]
MQQIINFLIRNKNNILFLLLLSVSLFLTIQSHSYQKSKFISSANFVSGGIYSWTSNINTYFNLEEYNLRLLEENQRLRTRLATYEDSLEIKDFTDTSSYEGSYIFRASEVINNNYAKVDNYLTLKSGSREGIERDMGVVTSKGIVGIVENVSPNYSTVISILNSNSRINAQLKKSNHFGTLVWNGEDPNVVQLIDVPAIAPVTKGDTIITGGRSLIFPKGIPIGDIIDYELDQSESYYTINIGLFNDMTNLGYVYIIENTAQEEIKELQNITKDE